MGGNTPSQTQSPECGDRVITRGGAYHADTISQSIHIAGFEFDVAEREPELILEKGI